MVFIFECRPTKRQKKKTKNKREKKNKSRETWKKVPAKQKRKQIKVNRFVVTVVMHRIHSELSIAQLLNGLKKFFFFQFSMWPACTNTSISLLLFFHRFFCFFFFFCFSLHLFSFTNDRNLSLFSSSVSFSMFESLQMYTYIIVVRLLLQCSNRLRLLCFYSPFGLMNNKNNAITKLMKLMVNQFRSITRINYLHYIRYDSLNLS